MTAQAWDRVEAAIEDWNGATGHWRIICARYGLRMFSAWRFACRCEREAWAALLTRA